MSKWFRVTAARCRYDGVEFEVADDATEQEIADAAHQAVIEFVDYGFVEIDGPDGEVKE